MTAALHRDVSMLGDSPKEALVPYCSEGWGPACKRRGENDIECTWETAKFGKCFDCGKWRTRRAHVPIYWVSPTLFKFRANVFDSHVMHDQ